MAVTIQKILTLPSFKGAAVLAGEDSLDNVVRQVSIADSPITELDYIISKEGDFYLSEFYFAKDSKDDLYRYLDVLICTKGSGLCLLDEYIQELPAEIIDYCNEKKFPVLLVSVDVPYALMITEIMELIIADAQNMLLEKEITSMIEDTIDDKSKLKILKTLNPHFQNQIIVFYVLFHIRKETATDRVCNVFNHNVLSAAAIYKNGILGFVTYNDSNKQQAEEKTQYYLDQLANENDIASIGISSNDCQLENASKAIKQALAAAEIGLNNLETSLNVTSTVIKYQDLGILRLLMLLAGQPELEEFSHNIIGSLTEYDQSANSQIFHTMYTFYKNGYHYKKTAQELYVHENTVRYRIDKAQELICARSSADDFRETFSIAMKCKKIMDIGRRSN